MPDQQSGIAEINGTKIAYDVIGNGPALVLIHAGIADRRMWDDQIPAFSRDYRVVRYDMRGFGESTMPPSEYAHHEDLRGLLRHLGIAQTHILGISQGGQVAIDFTLSYPEMVTSLIRVNSGVGEIEPSDVLKTAWAEMEAAEENGDLAEIIDLETRLWVDGPNRQPEEVTQSIRDRIRDMNAANFDRIAEHEASRETRIQPPAIERLSEINVPTLIIVGDEDVPDVHTVAELMASSILHARNITITNAAHMVSMERPDEFNRIVLEFLGSE